MYYIPQDVIIKTNQPFSKKIQKPLNFLLQRRKAQQQTSLNQAWSTNHSHSKSLWQSKSLETIKLALQGILHDYTFHLSDEQVQQTLKAELFFVNSCNS